MIHNPMSKITTLTPTAMAIITVTDRPAIMRRFITCEMILYIIQMYLVLTKQWIQGSLVSFLR